MKNDKDQKHQDNTMNAPQELGDDVLDKVTGAGINVVSETKLDDKIKEDKIFNTL